MVTLDERIAGLATMSPAQLKAEWSRVTREPAPGVPAELLRRGIAYRLQERVHGRLPADVQRELGRLAMQIQNSGEVAMASEVTVKAGTRLVREWHGKVYHVIALEDGFLLNERRYESLTQIAYAITGTRWSGPRFFGLKRRPKPLPRSANG